MGAILAILANPALMRPVGSLISKIFRGGKTKDKVVAPTVALTVLSIVVGIARAVSPEFGEVLSDNVTPEMVGGVAAAVVAIVGYFQPESVA